MRRDPGHDQHVTDESESAGTRITSFPPKTKSPPRLFWLRASLSLRGLICMHSRPPPASNGPQPPPLDPHVGLLLWTRGRGETKCPVTVDSISGSAISLLVHARNFRPPISSKDPFPPSSIPVAGNLSSGMRPEAPSRFSHRPRVRRCDSDSLMVKVVVVVGP